MLQQLDPVLNKDREDSITEADFVGLVTFLSR